MYGVCVGGILLGGEWGVYIGGKWGMYDGVYVGVGSGLYILSISDYKLVFLRIEVKDWS